MHVGKCVRHAVAGRTEIDVATAHLSPVAATAVLVCLGHQDSPIRAAVRTRGSGSGAARGALSWYRTRW